MENRMEQTIGEMQEHICDNICVYTQTCSCRGLEEICRECRLKDFASQIQEQYDRINNFAATQAARLMQKYAGITKCSECIYQKVDDDGQGSRYARCQSVHGLYGNLEETDGCSRGVKNEG